MDLPESMAAIGEQLAAGGAITPEPAFFEGYDVFRVEIAQLCIRPWLAVDHASRLAADGEYFRAEVGSRSVVLVREAADNIHALRNACIHAGYRVCDEEAGRSDSLFCKYHGWSYALDGVLTDPVLRPEEADRSRYRLPRYAMRVAGGLILVDMSKAAANPPEASAEPDLAGMPDLAAWRVTARSRYPAALNWKYLHQLLWSQKTLALGGGESDGVVEFGPLSYVVWRGDAAALLRLAPRFPGQSEIEVIRLGRDGAPAHGDEAIPEALRRAGDTVSASPLATLERGFYDWYWSALEPQST